MIKNNKSINNGQKNKFSVENKIPFMHSIKIKALAGIVLVTIIPLILLGFSSFSILTNISGDLLVKSNTQAFQQVKYEIDEYVNNYEKLIRYLANDNRLSDPSSQAAAEALRQMDKAYEFIDRIIICDSTGKVLQHSKKDLNSINSLTVPEEMSLVASQTVMFSPEAFQVKVPLNNVKGKPNLIATVSFLKLRKSLEGISFGTRFHYYLVTSEGENVLDQEDFPKELISALIEKPCGAYGVKEVDGTGKSQVAISLPILNYNLRVFVFQDADEVYKIASAIKHRTYVVVFVLGFLALLAGAILTKHFTDPVISIAQKANELSEGNLKVNVRLKRDDEIGLLANSFNRMTARIRNKVFELSSVYKISQLISSASTYQQALDTCLTHIVTMFLAKRGSIMLLSEDNTKLRVESFKIFGSEEALEPEEPAKKFELKAGEGIAGQVVETGNAILCSDCKNDERFKNYEADGKKPPITLVSVPLTVHGKVFGVINLADRSTSSLFNEEDLALLKSIASQVAISIDNAKLKELALTDDSTGLFVEKYFKIRLDDEMKRAKRFNIPLSMAYFRIDNIESVIEKFGKKAEKFVFTKIADDMISSVRGTDVPCLYKKNIIAVILAHTTDEQAVIFAERFRKKVADYTYDFENQDLKVSLSVGINELSGEKVTREEFVNATSKALKKSESSGGNQSTVLPEKKVKEQTDEK